MPVNYGGFIGGLINTEEALANIEGKKLSNQINALALEQSRVNADIAAKTRLEMQAEAARQMAQGNDPSLGGGYEVPGGLTPEIMAKSEGEQPAQISDFKLSGGNVKEPKVSDVHIKEYLSELGFAQAAAKAGNEKVHLERKKAAEAALSKATTAMAEERKERKDRLNKVGNVLSGIMDEETLNTAVSLFGEDYPEIPQKLQEWGFPYSNGKFLWDETAAKKTDAAKKVVVDEINRIGVEERAEKRALELRRIEEQERANRERAEDRRRQDQLDRDRLEESRERRQETREWREVREGERRTEKAKRALERDPIYRDWSKFEITNNQAKMAIDRLNKGLYKHEVDGSQVSALIESFNQLKGNFRPQAGGKYQLEEVKKFDGMLGKVSRYWETLGRGTNPLSEEAMRDMALTMRELYDIANQQVIIRYYQEVDALTKGNNKFVDPDALVRQGDLNRLIQLNKAWYDMENGKKYLFIGDKNSHRKFEVGVGE